MRMIKAKIAAIDEDYFRTGYINLQHVVAFKKKEYDCYKTIVYSADKVFIIKMSFEDFEKAMLNQE